MSQKRGAYRVAAVVEAKFTSVADTKSSAFDTVPAPLWIRGSITDLSITGMRVSGPLAADSTKIMAVAFTLPSAFLKDFAKETVIREEGKLGTRLRKVEQREPDFKEMELYCKVIRHAYLEESKIFQYHVAFIELKQQVEDEIARFITLSQRYQLRHRKHIQ